MSKETDIFEDIFGGCNSYSAYICDVRPHRIIRNSLKAFSYFDAVA